jgi:hypothetical protein
VKVERDEVSQLDALAKKRNCSFLVIHHDSKGSFGMDWSDRSAGTFALGAAAEGQIHMARFSDLSETATERLVRSRGRHYGGVAGVLRFRETSLDFDLVMQGAASHLFGELVTLRDEFPFGGFTPHLIVEKLGYSRATAHRFIARLLQAGAIVKTQYGLYRFADAIAEKLK